jgi:hypothetical protein
MNLSHALGPDSGRPIGTSMASTAGIGAVARNELIESTTRQSSRPVSRPRWRHCQEHGGRELTGFRVVEAVRRDPAQ